MRRFLCGVVTMATVVSTLSIPVFAADEAKLADDSAIIESEESVIDTGDVIPGSNGTEGTSEESELDTEETGQVNDGEKNAEENPNSDNQDVTLVTNGEDTADMVVTHTDEIAADIPEGMESVVEGLTYEKDGAVWDAATGTLTFVKSGTIENQEEKQNYLQYETNPELPLDAWYKVFHVPADVKKIVIKANVTVTGRFDITSDCTIEGENWETSKIFGTTQQRYSHNRGDEYGKEWDTPWKYSMIDVTDAATVTVRNLTIQNPFGYCISGYAANAIVHCDTIAMLDTRGGNQNNSDGLLAQSGSSIKNSYISLGDDAIKAYHSIDVENVAVKMLQNGAPIQLGWGKEDIADDVDDEDITVNIRNLDITSEKNATYNYNRGIISFKGSDNEKTVNMNVDGCNVIVPNARLFEMNPAGATVNIAMKNTYIHKLKEYGTNVTQGTISINGDTEKRTYYINNNDTTDVKENVVEGLYYDAGGARFDETTGTLTFVKSGQILNPELKEQYSKVVSGYRLDALYKVFNVPEQVKKIVINSGVTVNGRFAFTHDCTIEGEDGDTSVIYGTDEVKYSRNRKSFGGENWQTPWLFCGINVNDEATVYVKNLKIEDPFGYCIGGYKCGAVIHCEKVKFIDDRSFGDQNNSDGFIAQDGSSLKDCFMSIGDDFIKLYHNMAVENVTCEWKHFGAVFQLGWGKEDVADDVDDQNVTESIKNISVYSPQISPYESGTLFYNKYMQGIFAFNGADNEKTAELNVDTINVDSPGGNLFGKLNCPKATVIVNMDKANIDTNKFTLNWNNMKSKYTITINGSTKTNPDYIYSDKSMLEKYIEIAQLLDISQCPDELKIQLQEQITNADTVKNNVVATDEVVQSACEALVQVIQLVQQQTVKKDLVDYIGRVENTDISIYTDETAEKFSSALTNAKNIVDNIEASVDEIGKALADLEQAFQALSIETDKSKLQSEVENAETLDGREFTQESYDAVQNAIIEAKNVLNAQNATQEQIDNALTKLKEAISNLISITDDDKEEPQIGNKEDAPQDNLNKDVIESQKTVSTGDENFGYVWAIMLIVSVAAGIGVMRRRIR